MNLANEVSSLETQLANALAELELRKKTQDVLEFENDQLRRANSRLQGERDNYMRRSEQIKSILDQTGASLVHSIQKYHDSERELQEEALGVGKDTPAFLQQQRSQKVLADTMTV